MHVREALRRIDAANQNALGPAERDGYQDQRDQYEKTLRELQSTFEGEDLDDEALRTLSEWIVERIHETGSRPASRTVRGRAEELCRSNGVDLPVDTWLRT